MSIIDCTYVCSDFSNILLSEQLFNWLERYFPRNTHGILFTTFVYYEWFVGTCFNSSDYFCDRRALLSCSSPRNVDVHVYHKRVCCPLCGRCWLKASSCTNIAQCTVRHLKQWPQLYTLNLLALSSTLSKSVRDTVLLLLFFGIKSLLPESRTRAHVLLALRLLILSFPCPSYRYNQTHHTLHDHLF